MKTDDISFLAEKLFSIGAVKFGEFSLKSGNVSPVYLDLRVLVSYPQIMKEISDVIFKNMDSDIQQICGVPYTALPIASCISISKNLPMVIKRKEAKSYGTKKMIEGVFDSGSRCCVIEDVITTGSSVLETIEELEKVGLKVTQVIVLVDRGHGGKRNIEGHGGLHVNSVFTLSNILDLLYNKGRLTEQQYQVTTDFIKSSTTIVSVPQPVARLGLDQRAIKTHSPMARKLFSTMDRKRSRLCVSADVDTSAEILILAKAVAPFIAVLKVHSDALVDFSLQHMKDLNQMSKDHDFLIMEDSKLGDIGDIAQKQLLNSVYKRLQWCHLLTVHCIPGPSVLQGVAAAVNQHKETEVTENDWVSQGCLLIVEMSSAGAPHLAEYREYCARMAVEFPELVVGFVAQSPVLPADQCAGLAHCTPGLRLDVSAGQETGDSLGQQYRGVDAVGHFTDLFIVGRGITATKNVAAEAQKYRDRTFFS